MNRAVIALTAAFTALMFAGPASAQAPGPGYVKAGMLYCDIAGGTGFVIGSRKELACRFEPAQAGSRREIYAGMIGKLGVDLGVTTGTRLVWAVWAPTTLHKWALAGGYGGATAEATVGAGVGANVLFGGSSHTISLQPISVQGQGGLNVAAGVAGLTLHRAR